jgi:peptidoglycan glycosyltransferase
VNASTGEILANVSFPGYNPKTQTFKEIITSSDGALQNKTTLSYVPGSVMKIISAAAIASAGLSKESFNDDGKTVINGYLIHNYGNARHGKVTLKNAIGSSINAYFAHMIANEVGKDDYEKTLKKFLVGETVELDFANLNSKYNIKDKLELATTAYGQGETLISPLQIAMVTSAVSNNGQMVTPYMVLKKTDKNGESTYEAKKTSFQDVIDQENIEVIKEGMALSAKSAGFGSGIYSKTGTAETGKNNLNHIWMTAFFTQNEVNYVVTYVSLNKSGTGSTLRPKVDSIIKKVKELY